MVLDWCGRDTNYYWKVIGLMKCHVKSGDIRDLKGTVEREQAAIGVFITLEKQPAI